VPICIVTIQDRAQDASAVLQSLLHAAAPHPRSHLNLVLFEFEDDSLCNIYAITRDGSRYAQSIFSLFDQSDSTTRLPFLFSSSSWSRLTDKISFP
jgi:hypothetical protein